MRQPELTEDDIEILTELLLLYKRKGDSFIVEKKAEEIIKKIKGYKNV
jgi:uncharacterized protein YlzI (FlbEa/FlbD family)